MRVCQEDGRDGPSSPAGKLYPWVMSVGRLSGSYIVPALCNRSPVWARACARCTRSPSPRGSAGPAPRGKVSIWHPASQSLPPAWNSEQLLAFSSASVIKCKRGLEAIATLLSPRMDFPQLTRLRAAAVRSLLP